MLRRLARAISNVFSGIAIAVRARPKALLGVTSALFVLSLFLPAVVLSVARRPWDYFTFNPWLSKLPEYLTSSDIPIAKKLEFLPNLALFWFSADSPVVGVEWGYAVDVRGLVRIIFTSLLFGAYFTLWWHRRASVRECGWAARGGGHGGFVGALASTLGLSAGPCSVIGCGAPVMPVVGLAFTGLTSSTIQWLSALSRVGTSVVLWGMVLGVVYLGWHVGGDRGDGAKGVAAS